MPRNETVASNAAKILVRPKEKGETQSMTEYVMYFKRVILANSWSDAEAGQIFPAMLGPEDRTLDSLEGQYQGFEQLTALLLKKEEPLREVNLGKLMRERKSDSESIEQFRNRIVHLVGLVYPSFSVEVRSQLARDHLLHGLPDSVRVQVQAARAQSLEDTFSIASSCLALKISRDEVCPVSHESRQLNRQHLFQRRVRCFGCGRLGHIVKECRFKNETRAPENSRARGNAGQLCELGETQLHQLSPGETDVFS